MDDLNNNIPQQPEVPETPQQQPYQAPQQPPYQAPQQPVYQAPQPPQKPQASGLAVGSMVCGIIALVCCFFGTYALLGTAAAVVGLVLAIVAGKNGDKSGMRTAGLVMSIIGLAIATIVGLSCIACTCAASNAINGIANSITESDLSSWANELSDLF